MYALIAGLDASEVTDIVSVGIGGSDLGPRLVVDALRPISQGRFRVHFVSNVDGAAMRRTLDMLDPSRTAGILISKTFGTQETLLNGRILYDWLGGSERLYAVTANPERAANAFDIVPTQVLPNLGLGGWTLFFMVSSWFPDCVGDWFSTFLRSCWLVRLSLMRMP